MKLFFLPLTDFFSLIWLFMVIGVGFHLWRRQWRSAAWLGIPVALLFVLGSTPLVHALVASAERPYASALRSQTSAPRSPSSAILVLGGGFYPSEHDPYGFALVSGASRIATGLELAKQGRATNLVLGGSVPLPGSDEATSSKVQNWVTSLGVQGITVTNLGICRNTFEEALAFKPLMQSNQWTSVLLVTSALHMPRSIALFRKQGLAVEPVACDFRAYGTPKPTFGIFPSLGNFELLGLYTHEKIGWLVYKLRGWI
jgi:uncharacterized SAM-binding protein YcdF (DUF218 family)